MNLNEHYANSLTRRPSELDGGGRGLYGCIPGCKNASYDRFMNKTNIGFFTFPDDKKYPDLRKQWVSIIKQFRRKSKNDPFKINSTTRICEFHFKAGEIKVSARVEGKTLLPGVVPTVFNFRPNSSAKKRKSPVKRVSVVEESESEYEDDDSGNLMDMDDLVTEEPDMNQDNFCQEKDAEIIRLIGIISNLQSENAELKTDVESFKCRVFNFENIPVDSEKFIKFTGLALDEFHILQNFLDPGRKCENTNFCEPRENNRASSENNSSSSSKRGRKPKMRPSDQLFLFLTWLKCGLTLYFTSWLFDTPKSTVSRYIITWANFMYFSLGSVNIWPSKKQITDTMPGNFRKTYPSTRVIIDCTELYCQRSSSLSIQSSLYSSYKHHVTYKGFIGIAPSGAITFVSQLYDGSISDKEIVSRSGLLTKELWSAGDSLMADRGFNIHDMLEPMQVHLNIPAFLSGISQLTKDEVRKSQTIASVRIHVERAIQRIKKFRQIRNEIPLSLHGSINQIWTVACLLCNFMSPLIQNDLPISDEADVSNWTGQWGSSSHKTMDFSIVPQNRK